MFPLIGVSHDYRFYAGSIWVMYY